MSARTDHVAQRRHVVPGLHNLRDIGGYPTAGGAIEWGRVFRSDAPSGLDPHGWSRIEALGVAEIIDLRGTAERESAPVEPTSERIAVRAVPVYDDASPAALGQAIPDLGDLYRTILDTRPDALVEAVQQVIGGLARGGVLVHCTAGKDRTGVVVALLLGAVGVDPEDIVADYAATEALLAESWAARMVKRLERDGRMLSPEAVALVTTSPAPAMAAMLDHLDGYGGAVGYLTGHGLGDAELELLAARLIGPESTPATDPNLSKGIDA